MANPNSLFLLADHIKLSLLERQRAQALDLESDSQDGHISRSLDQFRDQLEALDKERARLQEAGDENKALNLADALSPLRKQLNDLTSQFHGFSSPSTAATLTSPNDPSLAADFAHAASSTAPTKSTLRSATNAAPSSGSGSKTVRFRDDPSAAADDSDLEAQNSALFNRPYRDAPRAGEAPEGYRDEAEAQGMDNQQLHAYHAQILADQDEQLDALGESIGRQRELSMRIGDELDAHVVLLEEAEMLTDRHQGRLDRAKRQLGRLAGAAGESRQMVAIIVLIVILVLLIAVLK